MLVCPSALGRCAHVNTLVACLPQGPEDVSNFLKYAIVLTRVHLQLSKLITPLVQNRCCLAVRLLVCQTIAISGSITAAIYLTASQRRPYTFEDALPVHCGSHHRDRRMAEIREAHARYSAQQLENDKTTRVLEAGFGKEFTKRYMRTGASATGVQ